MELKIGYKKIIDILTQNKFLIEYNLKNQDREIKFISYDSRKVKPDTLFFCKGGLTQQFKEEYLVQAVSSGAVCYISEKKYADDINADYFIVNNIRKTISLLASFYYNYPYRNFCLTGVTGTKGKTTVCYFLKNICDEYVGSQTGFSSSIKIYTGERDEAAVFSTPEPCELQQYFFEAAQNNIDYFTMEVSSQAYKTNKVYGVHFDNGIFLNIAEDHISPTEHDDFEDYLNCKLKFIKNCSNVVVNSQTDYLNDVLQAAENADSVILYGTESNKHNCDYYSSDIKIIENLTYFYAKSDKYNYFEQFAIKIQGLFNVENALAAIAMAKILGIDDESIRRGLIKTEVPGRVNIFENNGITVIVDYAHNYLSFTELYKFLREKYRGRRIISLGGTPGGRHLKRRRDFADIVGGNSEYVYLTADDPYFEDVTEICEDIAGTMIDTPYEIITDRKEAVTKAIRTAKSGDVVVLLAKGAETSQKIGGNLVPYESDLTIAQNVLFENVAAML